MNWKNKAWKYATAFVVVLIIFNPEMVGFALFIDAVGLEMFLMLLEIQVLAILGAFFSIRIKSFFSYIRYLCTRHALTFSWKNIEGKPETLMLVVPSPATLMHMLVFSAAIGIALNAQ